MRIVVTYMPPQGLEDLAKCIKWEPYHPGQTRADWLSENRSELCEQVELAGGHSVMNLLRGRFGDKRSIEYSEIVKDVAGKIGVNGGSLDRVELTERRILGRLWDVVIEKLTPEQREQFQRKAEEEAKKHGVTVSKELFAGGGLAIAQLGGFATYMMASTILGVINGALGLGLGFGVFMGVSKLISAIIGPPGWAALGGFLILKWGAPNYKKTIPAVVTVALYRNDAYVHLGRLMDRPEKDKWITAFDLVPETNSLLQIEEAAKNHLAAAPHERDPLLILLFSQTLRGSDNSTRFVRELHQFVADRNAGDQKLALTAVVKQILRIGPECLDNFLHALALADASLVRFCYEHAPEYGDAHYYTIMTIAGGIAQTLNDKRKDISLA